MRELLERYERRVVHMEQMLRVPSNSKETTERLKIKLGVYRNTVQEIKQELELHLVSESSWAYYEQELIKVEQLNQTQAPLSKQMEILRPFANKLGLYDVADYLRNSH
jgi:hypothetical protein